VQHVRGKRRQVSWKPAEPEQRTNFQVRLLAALEGKRLGLRSRQDLYRKLCPALGIQPAGAQRLVRYWLREGAALPDDKALSVLAQVTGTGIDFWLRGTAPGEHPVAFGEDIHAEWSRSSLARHGEAIADPRGLVPVRQYALPDLFTRWEQNHERGVAALRLMRKRACQKADED
jgi:hypothetical protein